ncbi:methionine--tRNA ligase [Mycoplasma sp. 'Moose RK']|uniref:methionine--tRNA ligase n=1 Tax=Mycoplasma sp. 'Moose RK' TaxID=2780095 RepID=UPI0018C1E58E|nr:methionine--tRNA ligase [Mycoplasma sp. 'Moose RK']MBG0730841.1 methionine--tRNA ligase [Mycoplasma sp. 'Moose RK']
MTKKFFITTPIYYASGNLHIGHLYTSTLAWVIYNFKKLAGFEARMLTGSDEHGQKISQLAEKKGLSPQQFVDENSKKFQDLWEKFGINYNYFLRSSSKKHKDFVLEVFKKMYQKGYIFKDKYQGLYSVSDEEFLLPKQAIFRDNAYFHPVSGAKMELISENSYFFVISKFQNWLEKFLSDNPKFIFDPKVARELEQNFFKKGLEDLSITRKNQKWGIKLENFENHTIYVWLDALFNYLSVFSEDIDLDFPQKSNFWNQSEEIVHVVGKEIARFHCIYWPIFLKSLNFRLPTTILTHGWLITPEGKMSKSKGNVINPIDLLDKFDPETIKLYLVSQINITNDSVFDETLLENFYNSFLVNTFGNLISRTVALIEKNFEKPLIFRVEDLDWTDIHYYEQILVGFDKFEQFFSNFQVEKAYKIAFDLAKNLNGFFDIKELWNQKNLEKLGASLILVLNGIYAIATFLSTVMPKNVAKILEFLQLNHASFALITKLDKFDEICLKKLEKPFFPRQKK